MLVSGLSAVILARLVDWCGPGAMLSARPSVRVRPWSIFVRFPLACAVGGDISDALLVKIRRHPDFGVLQMLADAGLRNQGRDEFDTLRRLETLTGGSDAHCAVRAVEYLDEWNALVMEELRARPVKTYLEHPRVAFSTQAQQRLEVVFERAGGLLRVFHDEVTTPHDGPIVDAEAARTVASDLAELESRSDMQWDVAALRELVGRVARLGQDQPVPHTRLHRDFNCANILVGDHDQVALLDPRMLEGPVYRDLAKLMVDLETLSVQGLTHGLYLRRSAGRFGEAALRGYFGTTAPNRVALEFFRIVAILDKWRYDAERDDRAARSGVVRFVDGRGVAWRRRFLAKLLERQRARLEGALDGHA